MNFDEKYKNIKSVVNDDLNILENEMKKLFVNHSPLDKDLSEFLTAPAKRLRPLLGFLFLRCLFGKITSEQNDVLLAVELIHNATLIHDDVIDKAEERRKQATLNVKFDNNMAVIAGDFLLSVAMEKVINTGSIDAVKICASALKSTCLGEINQHFSKFSITSIEDYIEKSRKKTALLFEIALINGLLLSEKPLNEDLKNTAVDFSQNFGIAFQIRDDLINVLNSQYLPNHDIKSGIYNAPVIFACEENLRILKEANIIDEIKKTGGVEKTIKLMDNYYDKAILSIQNLENNLYKKTLLDLIELLRTNKRERKWNQIN